MDQNYRPIDDIAYSRHALFEDIEKMTNFYKLFSFSVFNFVSIGSGASCNIDSYLFSSVQGTIESIGLIAKNGRLNDAYALLRKYFDSIIINIYTNLYAEDHLDLDNFTVEQIRGWVQGVKKMPKYGVMSQYIKQHPKVESIYKLIYKNDSYREIRDRCNDNVHYNFYKHVLLNDNEIYLKDRLRQLDIFHRDLCHVFVLHLAYTFFLNGHYMMSSDYCDSMEMNMTPEENSQYFVAPFIQEIFDSFLKTHRSDIANFIKAHTNMQLN